MPDYKKMYLTLVHEVNNTVDKLNEALIEAEEIYITSTSDDTQEETPHQI